MKPRNGILIAALCLSTIALAHGDGVESLGKVGDFEYLQTNTAIPEGFTSGSGPGSSTGAGAGVAKPGSSDGSEANFVSIRKNRPGAGDPSAFSYTSERPKAEAKPSGAEGPSGALPGQEQGPPPKEIKELDWKNPMSAVVSTGNDRGEVLLVEYGRNPETNRIEKIRINGQTEDVNWDTDTRKKLATIGGNLTMKAGKYTLKSLGSQQSAAPG